MAKTLKKKKQYNDAQIFVDGLQFLKIAISIVKNMDKDYKVQFGNDFIIDIRNMVMCFSLSYKHKNNTEKLQYSLDAYRLMEKIDISLRIMFESSVITINQNTRLSLPLGNLIQQIKGWVHSIGGEIDTNDVSEINETETNVDYKF